MVTTAAAQDRLANTWIKGPLGRSVPTMLLKVPGPSSLAYYGLGLAGVSCAKASRCLAAGGFFTHPGVN